MVQFSVVLGYEVRIMRNIFICTINFQTPENSYSKLHVLQAESSNISSKQAKDDYSRKRTSYNRLLTSIASLAQLYSPHLPTCKMASVCLFLGLSGRD